MKCPHCGGNNFQFARRCDHCGGALAGAARTAATPPGAHDVPDGGEPLDLRRHTPSDIPGKTVVINGAPYTILALSRSLPQADVYPLRHQHTRLVSFDLKVFRCTPDSVEGQAIKQRALNIFREKAALATESDPAANYFIVEEVYEQSGGLIGLQRVLGRHPGPAYDTERMARAHALTKAGNVVEAAQELDRVLAGNPNHIPALGNKAVLFARMGDISGAMALFWRCIELDPNDIAAYFTAAMFLADGGRPEPATRILRKALDRYAGDFGLWTLLVEIATMHDTLDMVDDIVERGTQLIAGSPAAQILGSRIPDSRERWRRYCAALDHAVSEQLSRRWGDALRLLDQCKTLTRRNALAELNRCICLFHSNDIAASVQGLRACLHRLEGAHGLAAYLLLLVGSADIGQRDTAKTIACDLDQRFSDPLQLPRIPVAAKYAWTTGGEAAVLGAGCLEDLSIDRIVATLDVLPLRTSCSAPEVEALQRLRRKYEHLAATQLPVKSVERSAPQSPPSAGVH